MIYHFHKRKTIQNRWKNPSKPLKKPSSTWVFVVFGTPRFGHQNTTWRRSAWTATLLEDLTVSEGPEASERRVAGLFGSSMAGWCDFLNFLWALKGFNPQGL